MGQDIRELFRDTKPDGEESLPEGHTNRFEKKLQQQFPQVNKKSKFVFLPVAATIMIAVAVGMFLYFSNHSTEKFDQPLVVESPSEEIKGKKNNAAIDYKLSDVSPEFKKIEDYYMATLNIQLARLNMTPGNKNLIDAFMLKLETLNEEYLALNVEIRENGLNGETVEALIGNLQLRLDLLKKLKSKLTEIEQSKNISNEDYKA